MDKAALARRLGIGAMVYAPLALVGYLGWAYRHLQLPGAAVLFLLFGIPLAASAAATALYLRLPPERQREAKVAPFSLALMLVLPILMFAYWMVLLSRLGDI